jgi:hypothetical protein
MAGNPEAFENSTLALCNAIGDDFSPAAAEFVERINGDMRSEIDLGRSKAATMPARCERLYRNTTTRLH